MNRFFRTKSLNIKVVKDPSIIDVNPNEDPFEGVRIAEAYAEISKDFVTHAAVVIGVTYSICKIIGKVCK